MCVYTADRVLRKMEEWYKQHKADQRFSVAIPFTGYDGLLGTPLDGIDLGSGTIEQKAREYAEDDPENVQPPWKAFGGGIEFGSAILSRDQDGSRILLNNANLQGANFYHAELEGALFRSAILEEANFGAAKLRGSNFVQAELEGANFYHAELQEANFEGANLQKANFSRAKLEGAIFKGANLKAARLDEADFRDARLEDVDWGHGYELDEGRDSAAEVVYRRLKQYYNGTGQYALAGEFHRRELRMKRKMLWGRGFGAWREASVLLVSAVLMGQGERPSWVLGLVVTLFVGFALAYWQLNALTDGSLLESIRYSAQTMVSFSRRDNVAQWAQDLALAQSFVSYVLLALFLVTIVRKVSPR